MARILHRLPFFDQRQVLTVAGEAVVIRSDQIAFWVSLTVASQTEFEPSTPRFPVLLDTGFSHNFAIREEQLSSWAGIERLHLPVIGRARLSGLPAFLVDASLWIHRNQRGAVEPDLRRRPFQISLSHGTAVYPRGLAQAPRLPLFGLRALRSEGLQLHIDARKRTVSMYRAWPDWLVG